MKSTGYYYNNSEQILLKNKNMFLTHDNIIVCLFIAFIESNQVAFLIESDHGPK